MPGQAPSFVNISLWQTPQACTLMRTCPAPGLGISRSTISKSAPGLETCAAFIGATATFEVAMMPPCIPVQRFGENIVVQPPDWMRQPGLRMQGFQGRYAFFFGLNQHTYWC